MSIESVLNAWYNRKEKGCDHIYYEFTSDITILTKGQVKTKKCLKCGDLLVK